MTGTVARSLRIVVVSILLCVVALTGGSVAQELPSRVDSGLIGLYDFTEASGRIVHDRSGSNDPLDLLIETPDSVRWSKGTLTVVSSASIVSAKSAERLVESIRKSNALTIEAWVTPANIDQTGRARIASLSTEANSRNFTLGKDKDFYDVRLRTTATDSNGIPSTAAPPKSLVPQLTHVVLSRDAAGDAALYIRASSCWEILRGSKAAI